MTHSKTNVLVVALTSAFAVGNLHSKWGNAYQLVRLPENKEFLSALHTCVKPGKLNPPFSPAPGPGLGLQAVAGDVGEGAMASFAAA